MIARSIPLLGLSAFLFGIFPVDPAHSVMPAPSAKNGKSVVDFPGGSAGRASMPARPGAFDPVSLKFYSTGMPVPSPKKSAIPQSGKATKLAGERRLALKKAPSNMRIAVLPVHFYDHVASNESTLEKIQEVFFGSLPTGSFTEYWTTVSGGKLEVTGQVLDWKIIQTSSVCDPPGEACYTQTESGLRFAEPNLITMVRDAVKTFDAEVDYSTFDANLDGIVDGLVIVHAGVGAEDSGRGSDIWSSMWEIDPPLVHDGVQIDKFMTVPELTCRGPDEDPCSETGGMTIGVIAHEFGHILGLPDLYDVSYYSNGIGLFDLMSMGARGGDMKSSDRPLGLSAWVRAVLGFATPKEIIGDATRVELPVDGETILKIPANGPKDPEQYFLVENRQEKGFDAALPCFGIYVWHIDEDLFVDRFLDSNAVQAFWLHRGIDLEEADGQDQLDKRPYLENRGDEGDCYPGSAKRVRFTRYTSPSSGPYFDFWTRTDYLYEVEIGGFALDGKKNAVVSVSGVSTPVAVVGEPAPAGGSTSDDPGYSSPRGGGEEEVSAEGGSSGCVSVGHGRGVGDASILLAVVPLLLVRRFRKSVA